MLSDNIALATATEIQVRCPSLHLILINQEYDSLVIKIVGGDRSIYFRHDGGVVRVLYSFGSKQENRAFYIEDPDYINEIVAMIMNDRSSVPSLHASNSALMDFIC